MSLLTLNKTTTKKNYIYKYSHTHTHKLQKEAGRDHVQTSTVWERFNRSLGVWCESLSRVRYHLGCSGDDKAQVQGPVIADFFSFFPCTWVCVCVRARVCQAKQTERPQPNTTPFIWPWLFQADCPHSRKSSSSPAPNSKCRSVSALPRSISKEDHKRC